jgi:hypothetical protein
MILRPMGCSLKAYGTTCANTAGLILPALGAFVRARGSGTLTCRARLHCHFAPPPIHFMLDSLR